MSEGQKFDEDKPKFATFYADFSDALEAFVSVATYGAKKYGEDRENPNWSTLPDALPRIKDSLMRHVHKYLIGEETDNESGQPHLAHIVWNASILLKLEKINKRKIVGL